MKTRRYFAPLRCGRPATTVAPNGYRACGEHRPDVRDILFPSFGGSYLIPILGGDPVRPCDYPTDGLGAAPVERRRLAGSVR